MTVSGQVTVIGQVTCCTTRSTECARLIGKLLTFVAYDVIADG